MAKKISKPEQKGKVMCDCEACKTAFQVECVACGKSNKVKFIKKVEYDDKK